MPREQSHWVGTPQERRASLESTLDIVVDSRARSDVVNLSVYCLAHGWDKITVENDPWPRYWASGRTRSGEPRHDEIAERDIPTYATSLDAAMGFAMAVLPDWGIKIHVLPGKDPLAEMVGQDGLGYGVGRATTLPRAMVATVLRTCLELQERSDG